MVNEEKIRIMTKLARYEQGVSYQEIKESGYYRMDYIRSRLLVTGASYTFSYILILGLVALYHFEYLATLNGLGDIENLLIMLASIYILMMIGCLFFSFVYHSRKYIRIQKKRKEFCAELKRLEMFYEREQEGENG